MPMGTDTLPLASVHSVPSAGGLLPPVPQLQKTHSHAQGHRPVRATAHKPWGVPAKPPNVFPNEAEVHFFRSLRPLNGRQWSAHSAALPGRRPRRLHGTKRTDRPRTPTDTWSGMRDGHRQTRLRARDLVCKVSLSHSHSHSKSHAPTAHGVPQRRSEHPSPLHTDTSGLRPERPAGAAAPLSAPRSLRSKDFLTEMPRMEG